MFSIVVKSSDPKQDFFYWNFSFFQPSRRRVIGLRPIMTPPVNEDLHIWLAVGSLNTVQCWKNKPWLIRHFQQPLIIIILTILNTSDWPLRSRIQHISMTGYITQHCKSVDGVGLWNRKQRFEIAFLRLSLVHLSFKEKMFSSGDES